MLADGTILVAGTAVVGRTSNKLFNRDFALARYDANGDRDPSLGTGGKVTPDFNGNTDRANALVVQDDGSIVLAGDVSPAVGAPGGVGDFGLARYTEGGALDGSFGSGGKVTADIGGGVNLAQAIRSLRTERSSSQAVLTLPGSPSVKNHGGVARFFADGTLDSSFGTQGKVVLNGIRVGGEPSR